MFDKTNKQTNKVTYYLLSWNWAANIFAILSVSFFLDDGDMLRCCLGPLCDVGKVCNYKDQNKNMSTASKNKTDFQLYLTNKARRLKHLLGMTKNRMFTWVCTQTFLRLLFMWTSRLLHDIKQILKPVRQEHLPASTYTSTPTVCRCVIFTIILKVIPSRPVWIVIHLYIWEIIFMCFPSFTKHIKGAAHIFTSTREIMLSSG